MMNVSLESMNQRMDFQTKSITNTLVLRLPSGVQVEASLADSDVAKIIGELAGNPYQAPVRDTDPFAAPMNDEGVHSFGGGAGAPNGDAVVLERPRPHVVRKDDAGNPVISGVGFRDPGEITGNGDDRDEDGVSQA